VVALDPPLLPEEPSLRDEAQCDDHSWLDNRDLDVEVGPADEELVSLWVAVVGRMTQDRVGDVRIGTRDTSLDKQLVKDAPGGPNERTTLTVLVPAWSLAQEQQS